MWNIGIYVSRLFLFFLRAAEHSPKQELTFTSKGICRPPRPAQEAGVGSTNPAHMIMAGVGETLGGSSELPAGMWFYAFMFGDARSSVPDFVSSKRLPVPSSLVIGMAVGMGLTAVRLLLDFVVFKVGASIVHILSESEPRTSYRRPLHPAFSICTAHT